MLSLYLAWSMILQPLLTSLPPYLVHQMNQHICGLHLHLSDLMSPVSTFCIIFWTQISILMTVLAWCIQYIQPQSSSSAIGQPLKAKNAEGCRLKITCFWQHDLKALFSFASSGLAQQLSTMALGLLKTVKKRASRIPKLVGYGHGVSLGRVRFEIGREALTVEYSIIPEDGEHTVPNEPNEQVHGMDEVYALREQRRLTRSIECVLPSAEGWDVQITTKASSEEVEQLPWHARAIRSNSAPLSQHSCTPPDQIVLRVTHAALVDDHSVLKVKVVIEISGPSSGLRLNGLPKTIQDVEERDPSSYFVAEQLLQDISSIDLSLHTSSSMGTVHSTASASASTPVLRPATERSAAAEKSILSRVRRNYIYFSSLLQEPEAKWRRSVFISFICYTLPLTFTLSKPRTLEEFLLRNLTPLTLPLWFIEQKQLLWALDFGTCTGRLYPLELDHTGISNMRTLYYWKTSTSLLNFGNTRQSPLGLSSECL